jgi:hypothetical protein
MSVAGAPRRLRAVELLIAAICVVSLAYFAHRWFRTLGVFWDTAVYERAAVDYASGANPWRTDALFPFVYHPLILRVLAFLNGLVPLRLLLPALTLAVLVWVSRELTRASRSDPNPGPADSGQPRIIDPVQFLFALAVAGAFGGIGVPALMSGNLAPLLSFSLVAALLRGRYPTGVFSRYLPYATIPLFALIKPYLLLFLAVPVMLYERRVIALVFGSVVVALFGAIWISFGRCWPDEYAQFLAHLRGATLGRGDLGYTFFHVFGALTHNVLLALVLHTVVVVLLLALVQQFFKQKYAGREAPFLPHFLVLYLVLTLANPRMKEYDLFPALVGFFAVFGALSRWSAYLTLAALLPTVFPLTVVLVPAFVANHLLLFDPFGTWQMVGLAVLGITLLVAVLDGDQRAAPPVEGVRV